MAKYSRMDQVKFMEDSLWKILSDFWFLGISIEILGPSKICDNRIPHTSYHTLIRQNHRAPESNVMKNQVMLVMLSNVIKYYLCDRYLIE